jgi:hypothetical protein
MRLNTRELSHESLKGIGLLLTNPRGDPPLAEIAMTAMRTTRDYPWPISSFPSTSARGGPFTETEGAHPRAQEEQERKRRATLTIHAFLPLKAQREGAHQLPSLCAAKCP